MKFMFFVLPTVPATLEERKRLRPIGRNNDRYQMMLDELRKLAVLADDAGAHQSYANKRVSAHSADGAWAALAPRWLATPLPHAGKRHKALTDWAKQAILQTKRWLPNRRIVMVADVGFSALELIAAVRRRVCLITRLRLF